ncbi:RNA polymerase sigma factor (sigma-70 family) [Staphylococcus epidermidis]|uniref:RNA polymerase subunit sigma-70 n=1 Tax=Staphylococcus epidermidis TaxID=1282 RepID=UPI00138B038D|nr:RNA polymerase subunit sigma-70 [Staphylococcus epidermidis]MBM0847749.1 RNA polymerase subunit sigma-70 [Staphylococcus epidermidis]MCG2102889.1 RNA polymerase subunit sigma-70 [Staphylococcus epidermidis]MCG2501522.1 RNA polymerase subunit sigma-70 [Staphylococcus epidermidis]
MKYSKETIKQFIKDYQNNTTIDISESELDIDNFFEINDDVEAVDVNDNIDNQIFYNELERIVDRIGTRKEYFVFYLLCQGKSLNEVGNIFNLSGERIRQLYNGLLDKIADEVD